MSRILHNNILLVFILLNFLDIKLYLFSTLLFVTHCKTQTLVDKIFLFGF